MSEEEKKADLFLNALASETCIDSKDVVTTGKSVGKILDDNHFLSSHVRCICGIHAGGEDIVQCSVCSMYLHRKCIQLPKDFDETTFICPFCLFQNYSIDPLASLGSAFDAFNSQIQGIYSILKRIEILEKQTRSIYEALSKPDLSRDQRMSYDEKYRQILSSISTLSEEWKEKTQIIKAMQTALHTAPNAQQQPATSN